MNYLIYILQDFKNKDDVFELIVKDAVEKWLFFEKQILAELIVNFLFLSNETLTRQN